MDSIKPGILILTPFYFPNIGGVETHLSDLTAGLIKLNYFVSVLTYSPITTQNTTYLNTEISKQLYIRRYKWFGKNIFHTIEKYPLFDFLYLTPYLLIRSFIWMIFNYRKINIIHSHGFNAAFIGNILGFCFNKKHITSTHAIYDHISGISQRLVKFTLNHTNHILCLSQASANQLIDWGVNKTKISTYLYWLDLSRFKPNLQNQNRLKFLFVGRLIKKKGIYLFLKLAKEFPKYEFTVIGTGPEQDSVKKIAEKSKNIRYLGFIPNGKLQPIYQQNSVLCVPSLYNEGYGRVVMEAVACGIPVISSHYGGLPEALDNSVAILIKPTINNFIKAIKEISDKNKYLTLKNNCRIYAKNKFSEKNIYQIINWYEKI